MGSVDCLRFPSATYSRNFDHHVVLLDRDWKGLDLIGPLHEVSEIGLARFTHRTTGFDRDAVAAHSEFGRLYPGLAGANVMGSSCTPKYRKIYEDLGNYMTI